jgi:hypothetical protein
VISRDAPISLIESSGGSSSSADFVGQEER